MKEAKEYLEKLLNDGDTIVIGLSGGPDSMCLLDLLQKQRKKIKIICAHINHNIREESKDELIFVSNYCKKNNLKIETTVFAKEENSNELKLREKRYAYFEKIVKKYNAKYLFTAHHGDDLIETILMRITRGSNLKGYIGFTINSKKNNCTVIKPLIYTTKKEIKEYLEKNNIPYVLDRTNDEDEYTRNRYRHKILPFLKEENPMVHLKYLKFSNELEKYYNFVNKIVQNELKTRFCNNILDIKEFDKIEYLIQEKIIESILDFNYPDNLYLVNDKHTKMVIDMIGNSKPNITINLPDNFLIIKEYNKLKFTHKTSQEKNYNMLLNNENVLPNGKKICKIAENNDNSNYTIRLNSEEIELPLYIRNRKNGDKIHIKNMKSPKKIKDIYINSKLTKEQRNNQPILVDSKDNILWIPGLKKSKFTKEKNEKYDIILWYN